ncbi:MAG: glycosyltransferase family 4 protein [Candidatus Pacebacteria bacterium]|nr:glycosyltransferase family 4 protein [Candidatus Paceibacterota bacterium]
MKKALFLMLNRSHDQNSIKDGGPALTSELTKALKRKNYSIDYISGNDMAKTKQHSDLSPLLQRIQKANEFGKFVDKNIFKDYDLIFLSHPSTAMGFEATDFPIEKTVLFPTLLGREYAHFMEVPKEYIDLEKKILSFGYKIQTPSNQQFKILNEEYNVPKENILIKQRGFSPSIFPIKVRHLRNDVSKEKPLRLMSANAVRPQKGYMELIDIVDFCIKKELPVQIVIYGDTIQSSNETYLKYAQNFVDKVQEKNLQEYFEFHPSVEQELLSKEMEKVDLAIIPSIYESFGKSALEASASGLPTIVFDDISVYREFLNDQTAIFTKRNPKDFYKSIIELISAPEKYNNISISGIENGKKYVSENIYDELIQEIEDISSN